MTRVATTHIAGHAPRPIWVLGAPRSTWPPGSIPGATPGSIAAITVPSPGREGREIPGGNTALDARAYPSGALTAGPPGDQGEQVATPDLGQHPGRIEVNALVDDAVVFEEEHRERRRVAPAA